MKESVAIAKDADRKKGFSPTRSDKSIHRVRNESERHFGSLRSVIDNIRRNGGTPSVESIATELSSVHSAQRAPVLLALQRTHGNRYVQRVVAGIQAKLKIGQQGDMYEWEADRVADAVMRMPEPQVQRQLEEEEEFVQTKGHIGQTPEVTPAIEYRIQALRDGGQPLRESVRAFFEPRFGFDFSQIRLHTGTRATNAARELNAQAFTIGQDIYFDDSYYQPNTKQGQQLLAHELTHTIQQGSTSVSSSRGIQTHCTVSRPGDLLEREPDQVASCVVDGEASIGPITAGSARRVQRFGDIPSWEELVSGAEELYEEGVETGGEALEWAEETGGEALEWAEETGGEALEWAEETGGEALEWAEETAEEAVETVGEAAEWLATTAGQAAIEAANALAGLFGGSVIIRRGCIILTIPNIPLFPTFRETLGETPPVGFFVPFAGGGTLIGPFPVAGVVGALAYAQLSAEAAVGPGVLRNFRVEICPFAGRYMGTAQLYAAAAIGPRLTLFGGLFAAGGILIPVKPPIPIIAIIEGGLRGIGTGWLIGAVQDTVTVLYSGGTLSFSNVTELMGGVLFQGDLQLFAALRLYNKIICQYAHPLGHWETGRAMRLTIPISVSLSGKAGTGGVGPITWGPMPIEDIETAIRPLPTGWNCLSWQEIKQVLSDNGVLPPELCEEEGEEEPGVLKKYVIASGRCKCVGDDACGGGKMYEVCYKTQKDCNKAQKDLDNFCNNNSEMKKKCTRPKCYYRHSDPKCPDNCDPGTIKPLLESPEAVKCPTQTVTMSGAKCGSKYGAVGTYSYSGAQNWWFKENVKNTSDPKKCQKGKIDQTTDPFQSSTGRIMDKIFNFNGPPAKVAPCTHTTKQTVFAGPTKSAVEQCKYFNTQIIKVTVTKGSSPKSGKVETTSAGVSTDCNWS